MLYAGVGLLGLAAGYVLCAGGERDGASDPSVVLGPALRQGIILAVAWAVSRYRRWRTLATALAVSSCGLLAAYLGCGLALALAAGAI
jgi:hypothetical protein